MVSPRILESELRRVIEGDVRFDQATLAIYSTDASNYRQVPVGVVVPRHIGDVINTVALARENSVPLMARGGGTSASGQTCNTALVIDFSKYMNKIHSIDPGSRLAVVEPGVVQSHLNAALAPHGLFFAPDPATKDRCTIGGMIGNNSCGAHSAAHGKTVDNLRALDVLLYDGTRLNLRSTGEDELQAVIAGGGRVGEIYQQLHRLRQTYANLVRERFPNIPRRVSGYNLDELLPESGCHLARAFAGSEGTLGLVLGATLEVVPRPKELVLVALGFEDIFIAADQVPWILEHRPEALEAFDYNMVEAGLEKNSPAVPLLPPGGGFLIVELGGATLDEARARGEALRAQARGVKACTDVRLLVGRRESAEVWGLRESGLGAGTPRPGKPRTWPGAEDVAVPPAKVGDYLRRFDQLLKRRGLEVAMYYGHFGEGCVHCRISFDFFTAAGIENFRGAMLEIGDLVAEFGGSISGEHGDGLARSELLPKVFGPELMPAFEEFKRIFDPDQRMNPGMIVHAPRMDEHLRLGTDYNPAQIATHFDFSEDGGLAGAALRCVGVGKCRKSDAGAMCPSYMVTREEKYSTRGRARLLFEALSGRLLKGGFTDEALKESLDLCLSCKSCKTECPAAVDMALFKAEFLSHYYRTHRRRLAAHLFGRVFQWAPLAANFPGLANVLAQSFIGRFVTRALGIHPERKLPRFARRSFRQWFAERKRVPLARASAVTAVGGGSGDSVRPNRGEVLFFPDSFTNFFDPDVASAAVNVLERAGFCVLIPSRYVCCGRPLYDQGMLDIARQRLLDVMQVLGPYVERGVPVVGVEPGCILTFRDELVRFFPQDERARRLAEQSFMLDEFLAKHAPDFVPVSSQSGTKPIKTLLHGHCHQKAISGIEAEIALLRRVPGIDLNVLDAGCCGMAGAFGYEKEHYEISRDLAQRVLVSAIQEAGPEAVVVTDGFSCRSQIRHFCPENKVMHTAQVLDGAAHRGNQDR